MKIAFVSDIHLEVSDFNNPLPEADVLLLGGDICVIHDLRYIFKGYSRYERCLKFFKSVSDKYKTVIYIPGNHEYWESDYINVQGIFNSFCTENNINNIIFNEKGVIQIEDIKFVYATLWTDFNKQRSMVAARGLMNDYFYIKHNNESLTPETIYHIHEDHKNHILENVKNHDKVLVLTHHAPNHNSVIEDYSSNPLNHCYYCTDMDDIILDNEQIFLWIHGHTHEDVEYEIGNTVVTTNCRGYYQCADTVFKIKVIEVD